MTKNVRKNKLGLTEGAQLWGSCLRCQSFIFKHANAFFILNSKSLEKQKAHKTHVRSAGLTVTLCECNQWLASYSPCFRQNSWRKRFEVDETVSILLLVQRSSRFCQKLRLPSSQVGGGVTWLDLFQMCFIDTSGRRTSSGWKAFFYLWWIPDWALAYPAPPATLIMPRVARCTAQPSCSTVYRSGRPRWDLLGLWDKGTTEWLDSYSYL